MRNIILGVMAIAMAGGVLLTADVVSADTITVAADTFSRASNGGLGTNELGVGTYPWEAYGNGGAAIVGDELVVGALNGGTVVVFLNTADLITGANDELSLRVDVRNLSANDVDRGYAGLIYNKQDMLGDLSSSWAALLHHSLDPTRDFNVFSDGIAVDWRNRHIGWLGDFWISLTVAESGGYNEFVIDGTPGMFGPPALTYVDVTNAHDNGGYFGLVVTARPGQDFYVAFDDFVVTGEDFVPEPATLSLMILGGLLAMRRKVG